MMVVRRSSHESDEFLRIVLDEAHNIKNRTALISKACYELKGQRRWALTGTPIVNRLEDLYSLLCVLRGDDRVRFLIEADTSLKLEPWVTTHSSDHSLRFPSSTKTRRRQRRAIHPGVLLASTRKKICATKMASSSSTCHRKP